MFQSSPVDFEYILHCCAVSADHPLLTTGCGLDCTALEVILTACISLLHACADESRTNYYSAGPSIGISPFGGFGSPFGMSPFGGFGMGMPIGFGLGGGGLIFQLFLLTTLVSLIGSAVSAATKRKDDKDDEW